MDDLYIQDDFFTAEQYSQILQDSKHSWEIRDSYMLYKDLTSKFYIEDCVDHIKKQLNKSVSIYRAYSHAQKKDLLPAIHRDVNATHTAILFVNDVLHPNWLGGTIVWTDKPNYVEPKSNRMLIFKAELEHTGSPLICDQFRIQCIWKINIDTLK